MSDNPFNIEYLRRVHLFLLILTVVATFALANFVYSSSSISLQDILFRRQTTLKLLQVMKHNLEEANIELLGNGVGTPAGGSKYISIPRLTEKYLNQWKSSQIFGDTAAKFSDETREFVAGFLFLHMYQTLKLTPDSMALKLVSMRQNKLKFEKLHFEDLQFLAYVRTIQFIEYDDRLQSWIFSRAFNDADRQMLFLFSEHSLSKRDSSVTFRVLERGFTSSTLDSTISQLTKSVDSYEQLLTVELAKLPIPIFGVKTSARSFLIFFIIVTLSIYLYIRTWLIEIGETITEDQIRNKQLGWVAFFAWSGTKGQKLFSWAYLITPGIVAITSGIYLLFIDDHEKYVYLGGSSLGSFFHGMSNFFFYDEVFISLLLLAVSLSMFSTFHWLRIIAKKSRTTVLAQLILTT